MKKGKKYSISLCVCPQCGKEMYVPRSCGDMRNKGHLKDLWCPFCKSVLSMREYRNGKDWWKNLAGEIV